MRFEKKKHIILPAIPMNIKELTYFWSKPHSQTEQYLKNEPSL